jgi:hypothetical protein
MVKVIEFYVPLNFQKKQAPVPESQKGKIIEFCVAYTKSA